MAESFSVKAILSAKDSGFSSTLKSASSTLERLGNTVKSGIGFGVLTGMGQQAFSALTNGARELVGEINSSSKAWKTYEGNMKILGKGEKEIKSVKKTLQDYAEVTVYSSSDMASSYAQLAAVGIKSADKLVTGFGGLAGAAENPAQAMKTLSQQGVQMAAKPSVAWQDFKLMLEQTPAGIAAVAKEMGMTTSEMVTAVQDGEISTKAFFKAVEKVGNSKSFSKLATEYKSVDQAADGLKETMGNKLMPAFDVLSQKGIKALSGIADKIGEIDGDKLADGLSSFFDKIEPYITAAKEAFSGVGSALNEARIAIKDSLAELNGEFGSTDSVEGFKGVMQSVADVVKGVAGFIADHSDEIALLIKNLPKIAIAIKGFQIAKAVAPGVASFTKGIAGLAGKGIGGIASKLFGISGAQKTVGTTSATSGTQMLSAAKSYALMGVAVLAIAAGFALLAFSAISLANAGGGAIAVMAGLVVALAALGVGMAFMLKTLAPMGAQMMPVATSMLAMGAAVLLVSAGFALLALTSIQLANAGGAAIGVMVGMVATIALLAIGAAALAPALTAGAVGLIAFGAAMALVGVGAVLAAASLAIIASVLPTLAEHGIAGAAAIATLGASMTVFAVGALTAGAAAIVFGAGLVAVSVGIVALTVGVIALAAGVAVLAVGISAAAVSMALAAGGLALLNLALPATIAHGTAASAAMLALSAGLLALGAAALVAGAGFVVLGAGLTVAGAGIIVFGAALLTASVGTLAMSVALVAVNSSMKSISSNAKSAASSLKSMNNSVSVVKSGLDAIGDKAKSAMNKLTSAFDNTASKAQSAGKKVGTGFANGVQNGLTKATSNAKQSTTIIIAVFAMTATKATASGKQVGNGFSKGVQSGMKSAVSVSKSGTKAVTSSLRAGYSGAYSAGAYISIGFAAGMRSQLGAIRSAANQMAAAADKAVRAKAKIHSPSRVSKKLGAYWGEGYLIGLSDMFGKVWDMAEQLVNVPQVATPALVGAYGGELSSEYEYNREVHYTIKVPLNIDGREFAKATAEPIQDELNIRQKREDRKHGKV
jgi:tape measure domain-containing protein